jgi:hypothetical protein
MRHSLSAVASALAGALLACALLAGSPLRQASGAEGDLNADARRIAMPGSPFGIAWGFIYGAGGVPAEVYMPQLRGMGAGFTKLYIFWSQVEPEKGRFDWSAIDTFVGQLQSPDEALVAVWSSSTWATRHATQMLPPSPAKDPEDYYRFIHALVSHCKGRVRYWQNDCEPNSPVYWSGTAEEFVAELKVFHRAVKDADPEAVVVVGGYDGLFHPPGSTWLIPGQEKGLAFFDHVLKEGADSFDVFDLRLYLEPEVIPAQVAYMRQKMADLGYRKPIICTEYNGPGFFAFPQNLAYMNLVTSWADSVGKGQLSAESEPMKKIEAAIAEMYAKMDTLAPQTQMFMLGCPAELEQKLRRIECRDLVMRNVYALSAGVQKTLYWDLWHDTSKRDDMMALMYSKHKLMDYEDGALKKRYPQADAFQRMAEALRGVEKVTPIEVPERPSLCLFEVQRRERGPIYVIWDRREAFGGEDQPPVAFDLEWRAPGAKAADALGEAQPVTVTGGRIRLQVSVTPIFIEPTE